MNIKQTYPLLLAVLMYGVATFLIIDIYVFYDYEFPPFSTLSTLFTILGNVASTLYICGTILIIGYFISTNMRKG